MTKNGTFNEQDLAGSDLAYLGVGRTLDKLAHLKENGLVTINKESFSITDTARQILWDSTTPLQIRILRLLQIKSFEESDIAKYLQEEPITTQYEIDRSRKQGFVIFTTIKKDERIIKVCELTQEGVEFLLSPDPRSQLQKLLQNLSDKVQDSKIPEQKINQILEKIRNISTELD